MGVLNIFKFKHFSRAVDIQFTHLIYYIIIISKILTFYKNMISYCITDNIFSRS